MSIDFLPYVHDADSCLWELPEAARNDPDAFELNVSNANGIELLLTLGLPPDATGAPMPIDAFAGLVTAALRRHLGRRSPERDAVTEAGP